MSTKNCEGQRERPSRRELVKEKLRAQVLLRLYDRAQDSKKWMNKTVFGMNQKKTEVNRKLSVALQSTVCTARRIVAVERSSINKEISSGVKEYRGP